MSGKIAPTLPGGDRILVQGCDLTNDDEIVSLHETLTAEFGRIDFVIHAVAFAHRDELGGRFADTSRHGFAQALYVSAYTLIAAARARGAANDRRRQHPYAHLSRLGARASEL